MSYQDDLTASEGQRGQDHKVAASAAAHKQADIDHYTRLVTASRKWNVKNNAMRALLNLGGPVPAGSFQQIDF